MYRRLFIVIASLLWCWSLSPNPSLTHIPSPKSEGSFKGEGGKRAEGDVIRVGQSEHFSSANGLSNDFVLAMAIDGQNYVWVGTEAGVNRIIGRRCLPMALTKELEGQFILSLLWHSPTSQMLIGTERGLTLYNELTGMTRTLRHQDGLAASSVNGMAVSSGDDVWLVFGNGQVQRLNCRTLRVSELRLRQPHNNRCILEGSGGQLYIGHSQHGLTVVDRKAKTWKNYQHREGDASSLPGNNVRKVYEDNAQRIWVGTDHGLALLDPDRGTFTQISHEGDSWDDNVYDIMQMGDGTLWVATDIGGIRCLDEQTQRLRRCFSAQQTSKNTRSIVQDEYGNIWIGNHSTGVDFISERKNEFGLLDYQQNTFKGAEAVPLSTLRGTAKGVYAIGRDVERGFWMAADDELTLWQDGRMAGRWSLRQNAGREYFMPRCLMADHQGYVWMGMDDEGVWRFNRGTSQLEKLPIVPEGSDVHSFAEDAEGRIWIGGQFGIYVYDHGQWRRHEKLSALTTAPATCIMPMAGDWLFVATLGGGVFSYNQRTGKRLHMSLHNGLPSGKVSQAIRDRRRGIWMATDAGLVYMADPISMKGVSSYGKEQGLADTHLQALQQTDDGNLWMSSYSGIACFNEGNKRFHNYNSLDIHLPSGFASGAAVVDDDGTLYFGAASGVCRFTPSEMDRKTTVSPVQLVNIEAYNPVGNNTEIMQLIPDENNTVKTSYRQNTIHVVFTIRDFAQAEHVEYSYMMKGMDSKWYEIGNDNDVVFRALHPGHYTFILRARLRNQDWTDAAQTSVNIYIAPPFWRSWWAYIIYAVALVSCITAVLLDYKRRLNRRNALEMERRENMQRQMLHEERMQFFTNFTHELRTPLTLISGPLADLRDDNSLTPVHRKRISSIIRNADQLKALIDKLLEFRKVEQRKAQLTVAKGDIGAFVSELCRDYRELYNNPKVAFACQVDEDLPLVYFDSEVITTVLNNFLSNAIKYTEEGNIDVKVSADGNKRVVISVADTGYGIAADALPHVFERYYQAKGAHQAAGTGIGLALVKSLANLHQAHLDVQSTEGKGCCFSFALDIDNTYPTALHKEDAPPKQPNDQTTNPPNDQLPQQSTLLVVEDNADIRQYIADSFEHDFLILQAQNGEEGLTLAREQMPDIIVSDIMMPRMNGIQLTRQLKNDIRTSHIPVILLTAKVTDDDKEEGYESGADSYLTKPFTARLLSSRIQNLLTARRRMAEYLATHPTTPLPSSLSPLPSPSLNREGRGGSPLPSSLSPLPSPSLNREGRGGSPLPSSLSHLDQEFLEKLNTLLRDNIMSQDIDLPFVTDKMAMSHSTFYRKVKALTGLTAKEYIRRFRLRYCYQLLESGEYNVNQAAMMTGFNQMAHFRDTFKKEFGMLPSEVVRRKKENTNPTNSQTTKRPISQTPI